MAYATCSPVVAETAGVVQGVIGELADVVLEDAAQLLPWVEQAGSRHLPGAVQLWPHVHGTDAMFLAVLRRLPEDLVRRPTTALRPQADC